MRPRHQPITDILERVRLEIALMGGDEQTLFYLRSVETTLETAAKHLQWQEEQELAMARLTARPAVEEPF